MLRYCVMRVNPVWSLSMAAAAVMGLVLLRRHYLNKVKRKTMGLQLKVTVDDKVCVHSLFLHNYTCYCFLICDCVVCCLSDVQCLRVLQYYSKENI